LDILNAVRSVVDMSLVSLYSISIDLTKTSGEILHLNFLSYKSGQFSDLK